MTTPTLTSDQIKALIGPNAEYPTKPQPDHLWRLEDIQKRLERIEQMLVGAPTPMLDEATAYAKRLLVSLMDKHFPDRHPEWAPLPDLLGILTQIDNLTTGLTRKPEGNPMTPEAFAELEKREQQAEANLKWAREFADAREQGEILARAIREVSR